MAGLAAIAQPEPTVLPSPLMIELFVTGESVS
jgi:hypothetical protein